MTEWIETIDTVSPEIIPKVREHIIQSEKKEAPGGRDSRESFLWDHTCQVAAAALDLCRKEKIDPIIPLLTALFHDAGKFTEAGCHKDEIPEEQIAAHKARRILTRLPIDQAVTGSVFRSLISLYQESENPPIASNIVHDADFLSKFGFQGAAQFFIKYAIRGQPLSSAVLSSASKEMTYAAVLPENMRTSSGKKTAVIKKNNTFIFFHGLLQELRSSGHMDLTCRITEHPCPRDPSRFLSLYLVEYTQCPRCKSSFTRSFSTRQDIKCRKLEGIIACVSCDFQTELAFCLPEIPC